MSQENVEIVEAAYDALVDGGIDRFMEHLTDDLDYRAVVVGAPDDIGPIHGKAAFRTWLQDWMEIFDGFTMELLRLIDAGGNTVVALERFGGRAKLSGVETDQVIADVFRVRSGKIASGREYTTLEQALDDAGLRSGG